MAMVNAPIHPAPSKTTAPFRPTLIRIHAVHDPLSRSWSIVEFVDIRRVIVSAPSEFPWM